MCGPHNVSQKLMLSTSYWLSKTDRPTEKRDQTKTESSRLELRQEICWRMGNINRDSDLVLSLIWPDYYTWMLWREWWSSAINWESDWVAGRREDQRESKSDLHVYICTVLTLSRFLQICEMVAKPGWASWFSNNASKLVPLSWCASLERCTGPLVMVIQFSSNISPLLGLSFPPNHQIYQFILPSLPGTVSQSGEVPTQTQPKPPLPACQPHHLKGFCLQKVFPLPDCRQ